MLRLQLLVQQDLLPEALHSTIEEWGAEEGSMLHEKHSTDVLAASAMHDAAQKHSRA